MKKKDIFLEALQEHYGTKKETIIDKIDKILNKKRGEKNAKSRKNRT